MGHNPVGRMWEAVGVDYSYVADYIGHDREETRQNQELQRRDVRHGLIRARVIRFDPKQIELFTSLSADEVIQMANTIRAPFESTLLDFGDAHMHELPFHSDLLARLRPETNGIAPESEISVYSALVLDGVQEVDPGVSTHLIEAHLLTRRHVGRAKDWVVGLPIRWDVGGEDEETDLEHHLKRANMPDEVARESARKEAAMVIGALAMLESVNVELVETHPRDLRGRSASTPHYEVVIKQSRRSKPSQAGDQDVDWSHRWEVRGNFAHHFETTAEGRSNRVFENAKEHHPKKVITIDGRECVRVWRSSYVKGPEDKPLLPKERTLSG